MKVRCDRCGGVLLMNPGRKDATCKLCGEVYSIAKMREMLGIHGDPVKSVDSAKVYFSGLLTQHFPAYSFAEDVRISGLEIPADFVLSQNGRMILVLFLLDSQDNIRRRQVRGSMEKFTREGVPALQFFVDYRNAEDYVVERIRQNLG